MITLTQKGDFKKTEKFLKGAANLDLDRILHKYGKLGVAALAANTPRDSGETANSWNYEITSNSWGKDIAWYNTHVVGTAVIAILIQYGHGTGTGGYVPPTDYVNPAMKSIFDGYADEIEKEVSRL